MAHGVPAAKMAELTADATFAGGHGNDLPSHAIATEAINIVDALIALKFAASKGEARRLIAGGGARIGGEKVTDEAMLIAPGTEPVKISAGKKQHGLIIR